MNAIHNKKKKNLTMEDDVIITIVSNEHRRKTIYENESKIELNTLDKGRFTIS